MLRLSPHAEHTLVVAILLAWSPARIGAQVLGQVRRARSADQALERLGEVLEHERGLSNETREALGEVVRALREERRLVAPARPRPRPARPPVSKGEVARVVDEYLTARPPVRPPSPWEPLMERISVYGDIRLRHETDTSLDDLPTRNRQRIRFRLGANYRLTDELQVGARLATGNRLDPNSPHLVLGEVFHDFDVSLDRMFATYRPEGVPKLWITGGKFAHPFWVNPVYGEMVWDADVHPEGVAAGYSFDGGDPLEKVDLTVGEYLLLEQQRLDDARAFVAQAVAHWKPRHHLRPSLGVAYYRFMDLTPSGSQTILADNAGNATRGVAPNLDFVSRFELVNPIFALTWDGGKQPVTVSAEYVRNNGAPTDADHGWALGASVGSARKEGDWRLYYQRQVVEQDAVLSVVAQDDFLFQTNHRTHIAGVNYQLLDSTGLNFIALISARDRTSPGLDTDSDRDQWRLRLDLNIKL